MTVTRLLVGCTLTIAGMVAAGDALSAAPPSQFSTGSPGIWPAAAQAHTLVLKGDGTVWAWGVNTNGEIADGTTTQRLTPVQVSGLS